MNGFQQLAAVMAGNPAPIDSINIETAVVERALPDLRIKTDDGLSIDRKFLTVARSALLSRDGVAPLQPGVRVIVISNGSRFFILDQEANLDEHLSAETTP